MVVIIAFSYGRMSFGSGSMFLVYHRASNNVPVPDRASCDSCLR